MNRPDIMDAVGAGLPSQAAEWHRTPAWDIPGCGPEHRGECWQNQHGDLLYTKTGKKPGEQ